MKKSLLFMTALLMAVFQSNAKNTYTYKLVKWSIMPNTSNFYVYPIASDLYQFRVELINSPSGFAKGKFTVELENAKFLDGTTKNENLYEGSPFTVIFDDISNQKGVVKITNASVINASADSLIKGSPTQFSYPIASLKGQTPTMSVSANPIIGSRQTITAQIYGDVIYPGIYVDNGLGGSTNKKAENYEWTLPPNWSAVGQIGSTFILGANQKSIIITPDYVTAGEIKVRALNALRTAGSEVESIALDRGFNFTEFPTSIILGDNTPKKFSTTLFSGITYEWSAPSGWQINGQGNTIEALNLNTVNITPTFCSPTDTKIRVRLKKDGEISPWYDCKNYQGIIKPSVVAGSSIIYQYEEVDFSINNINLAGVQSINCADNRVCFTRNQGANFKVAFLQTGTYTIGVSMLMEKCNTPVSFPITVSVLPHRIKLFGPSQLCDQATYTIDNLPTGYTIRWTQSPNLSYVSGQNTNSYVVKANENGTGWVRAYIATGCNEFSVEKTDIQIGTKAPYIRLCDASTGYQMGAGYAGTEYYFYGDGFGFSNNSNNYLWEVISPDPDILPISNNGRQVYYTPTIAGTYLVSLQYYGECGWSDLVTSKFVFLDSNDFFSFYPNPASENINVVIADSPNATLTNSLPVSKKNKRESEIRYDIKIYDRSGIIYYSTNKEDKEFILPVSNLRDGTYIIEVNDGKRKYNRQLIIKR